MKTIETTGTLSKRGVIKLDDQVNLKYKRKVKLIISLDEDNEIDEKEWIKPVYGNPAFDILNYEIENTYTVNNSKAYYGKKFTEN
jgi:hypothetical protein